ncbi:hypothetical protein EDC96DRAFT_431542, partial [Choanephora cucurbitarum]
TTQNWVKKDSVTPLNFIERAPDSGRPIGRPPTLTKEHRGFMVEWADNNSDSVTLDDMFEEFGKTEIIKSEFGKCVKDKCSIAFKQARPQSVERNSPEKVEERYQWAK